MVNPKGSTSGTAAAGGALAGGEEAESVVSGEAGSKELPVPLFDVARDSSAAVVAGTGAEFSTDSGAGERELAAVGCGSRKK